MCCKRPLNKSFCIHPLYSKVSRPDKLAVHVFEVDEEVDKDEVGFVFHYLFLNTNNIQLMSLMYLHSLCQYSFILEKPSPNRQGANLVSFESLVFVFLFSLSL